MKNSLTKVTAAFVVMLAVPVVADPNCPVAPAPVVKVETCPTTAPAAKPAAEASVNPLSSLFSAARAEVDSVWHVVWDGKEDNRWAGWVLMHTQRVAAFLAAVKLMMAARDYVLANASEDDAQPAKQATTRARTSGRATQASA